MATIDIGPGATERAGNLPANTKAFIMLGNPANASGTLDTFEIFAVYDTMNGTKLGTFHGSGTDYTMRDYESIGNVNYGSKQTFTGKNCDVESGDFIGWFATYGWLSAATSGGSGVYWYAGDIFDGNSHTCTLWASNDGSVYATGEEVAVGNPYYLYQMLRRRK